MLLPRKKVTLDTTVDTNDFTTSTASLHNPDGTYGYQFKVTRQCRLQALALSGSGPSFGVRFNFRAAVWSPGAVLLSKTNLYNLAGIPMSMPITSIPTLFPNYIYTVAFNMTPADYGAVGISSLDLPLGTFGSNSSDLFTPIAPVFSSSLWPSRPTTSYLYYIRGFDIILEEDSYKYIDYPRQLQVTATQGSFTISLPTEYVADTDFVEWELEYAQSADGGYFGTWRSVGTYPSNETYVTHDNVDAVFNPYYRYRFRFKSHDQGYSAWSETLFAGKALPAS